MQEHPPVPLRSVLRPAPALVGSRWRLVEIGAAPVMKRGAPWIEISRDVIGGYDGCNRFGLRYADPAPEQHGQTTDIGTIMKTLQGCAPEVADVEAAFTAALMAGRGFGRSKDSLELRNARGETTLRFERWPQRTLDLPSLVGTHWCLQSIDGVDVATGTRQTLAFPSTTNYRGFAGCRSFHGTLSARGDTLHSGSLGMDGSRCVDAVAMEREGAYGEQLSTVLQLERRGDDLLWTTHRSETLEFTPCAEKADGA